MALALLIVTGCSVPGLYRIDVQQGNVVTEEMLEKLKPGMTRSQVLFVMGSPLMVDAFRDNRWDYVYLFRERGDLVEQKRMTLFFDGDYLVNIENYLSLAKAPEKPKPPVVQPVEKEAAPIEKVAAPLAIPSVEKAMTHTEKAAVPVVPVVAPVMPDSSVEAMASTARGPALEAKTAAMEKKVTKNEPRRPLDDDDDDVCNVPSTVSIRP
ncbi:MAG: outer membrane protein assembly factor BamE [Nitrosomonas sp.]|nr:MAG: outer membrane protein assembly factor BamE [Nitrosomonas sp.]